MHNIHRANRQKLDAHQHLLNFIKLYRAIFDLACDTPTDDKMTLGYLRQIIINLNHTLYTYLGGFEHEGVVNLDFCQDFNEYILLKYDDDGSDRTGMMKSFSSSIRASLDEVEASLGS